MDTNQRINQLIAENERLKSQLVAVQDSVVHGKCANSEPCTTFCEAIATRKMFKQLQVDRDALAAQVVVLKKIAYNADGARQSNSECNYGDEKEWLRHLYNGVGEYDCTNTPEQHLAAHDAEVAAKAVLEFSAKLLVNQKVDVIDCAKLEADQLRAKAGE